MQISLRDLIKAASDAGASEKDILALIAKSAAGDAKLTDEDVAKMVNEGGGAPGAGAPPPEGGMPPAGAGAPPEAGPVGMTPPAGAAGPGPGEVPAGEGDIPPGPEGMAGGEPIQLSEEQLQQLVMEIVQALEGQMPAKTSEVKQNRIAYVGSFMKRA